MFWFVEFFVSQNGFAASALRLFRPIIPLNSNSEKSVQNGQEEFGTTGAGSRGEGNAVGPKHFCAAWPPGG